MKLSVVNKLPKEILIKAVAVTTAAALMFLFAMFLSMDVLIEKYILSKLYALIAGTLLCSVIMLFGREQIVRLDRLSLMIIVFVVYILIRGLFSGIPNIELLLLITFMLLYIFSKSNNVNRSYMDAVIVMVCLLQAVYGILQFVGVFNTYGAFEVVGSFDNPAGFAASLSVGYPFCFALLRSPKLKCFGIISAIVIAIAVFLSDSRTGIITIAIITAVIFIVKYKHYVHKYKRLFATILIGAFLIIFMLLFLYKKDSAYGRLLIWNNAIEMIKDDPVMGQGNGAFFAKYMTYQAEFFQQHPDSAFSMLADNVSHSFSEYILLTIEYGFIGLIFLILTVVAIIKSAKKITPAVLSLLSVAIFACFSYPIRYAPVIIILAYSLAELEYKKSNALNLCVIPKMVLFLLILFCGTSLVKDFQFEYKWGRLVKNSRFNSGEQIVGDYEKLYNRWNGDAFFLYNYGAVLHNMQLYEESNQVLKILSGRFNDYDIQMLIAENYFKQEDFKNAERYFTLASQMIPSKFAPLEKLLDLYIIIKEEFKAEEVAKKIIDKRIKIPSARIDIIILKANDYINNK